MKVNITGFENSAKGITKSKSFLKEAYNSINNAKPPSDFKSSSKLKSIPGKISSIIDDITSVSKWVSSTSSKMKKAEKNNQRISTQLFSGSLKIANTLLGGYVYNKHNKYINDKYLEQPLQQFIENHKEEINKLNYEKVKELYFPKGTTSNIDNIVQETLNKISAGEAETSLDKSLENLCLTYDNEILDDDVEEILKKSPDERTEAEQTTLYWAYMLAVKQKELTDKESKKIAVQVGALGTAVTSQTLKYVKNASENIANKANTKVTSVKDSLKNILQKSTNALWNGVSTYVGAQIKNSQSEKAFAELLTSSLKTATKTASKVLNGSVQTLTTALGKSKNITNGWTNSNNWNSLVLAGVGIVNTGLKNYADTHSTNETVQSVDSSGSASISKNTSSAKSADSSGSVSISKSTNSAKNQKKTKSTYTDKDFEKDFKTISEFYNDSILSSLTDKERAHIISLYKDILSSIDCLTDKILVSLDKNITSLKKRLDSSTKNQEDIRNELAKYQALYRLISNRPKSFWRELPPDMGISILNDININQKTLTQADEKSTLVKIHNLDTILKMYTSQ